MQIEPSSSIEAPLSRPASSAMNGVNAPVPPSGQLLPTDPSKSDQVAKQAITPINGKSNLLKFLTGKSTTFKTIGDRIVVPMKLPASSKALSQLTNKNPMRTFQMAIPASSSSNIGLKANNKFQTVANFNRTSTAAAAPKHDAIPTKKLIVKREVVQSDPVSFNNDLNNFMKSVTKSVFLPMSSHDHSETKSDESRRIVASNRSTLDIQEDDELTSLSWLSSNNKELLDTIRKCNPDDPGIGLSGDETDSDEIVERKKLIFTAGSRVNSQTSSSSHASNDFMYNPLCKPPYSFSCLIFMAVEDSYLKRLPVKEIYSWVCKHFPYYRSAPSGWKNSIRHNLSLNRCFKKADCRQDSVKGSLWCIDPAYRPNLVQALKRSPYYPYLHPTGVGQPLSLNNLANLLPGVHTGRLPSWSPALPPSTLWADPDMASAALNLMGLRGKDEVTSSNTELISNTLDEIFRDADWLSNAKSSRQRSDSTESVGTEELVICGDGQDHTYVALPSSKKRGKREEKRCRSPESDKSAPDAAYEFETNGFSDDDLVDDVIEEIIEDMEVRDEQSDAEDQSLFDSGFGSMKSFQTRRKSNDAAAEKTPRQSKRKRKFLPSWKKETRARTSNRVAMKSRKKKAVDEVSTRGRRRQGMKRPLTVAFQTRRRKAEKKNSDVDSGKDSPKCDRSSRSRRFRRRNNKSGYHTRSSSHKLVGQKDEPRASRRKRKQARKNDAPETDEDEVKLAAGSLMRLAGLMKSPLATRLDY